MTGVLRKPFIFIILFLAAAGQLIAGAGTSGALVLEKASSIRAAGMGEAFTAVAENASGALWNPAGLSRNSNTIAEMGRSQGFLDTSYNYLGLLRPLRSGGAVSLNTIYYDGGTADIRVIDNTGELTEEYSVVAERDIAFQLAYGKQFGKIDAGIGVKYLMSTLAEDYSATVICGDIGMMYHPADERWGLGLSVMNIGGSVKYIDEADPVAMAINAGGYLKWLSKTDMSSRIIADARQISGKLHIHAGNEFIWKMLALRLGWQTGYELKSLSSGIGINLGSWDIDLGYSLLADSVFGSILRVGLTYDFGKLPEKKPKKMKKRKKRGSLAPEDRRNIAIAELTPKNVSAMEASIVSDFIRTELVLTEVFNVVDRSNMEKILEEQAFQMTGCTNQECAVKMGKMLNVQWMVVGTFSKLMEKYYINVNLIDVENGRIIGAEAVECPTAGELQIISKSIAEKLSSYDK
ncbi:PorV/PorQ family protein [Elusimicrobiota bacterium]